MIPGFPSPPGLRTPPLLVPRKLSMKNISIVVKMNVLRYKLLYHLKFGVRDPGGRRSRGKEKRREKENEKSRKR